MDFGKAIAYIFNLLVFALVSIIFVPAFFIVTYLQKWWAKQLEELFKL